jgi:hypothetical protein
MRGDSLTPYPSRRQHAPDEDYDSVVLIEDREPASYFRPIMRSSESEVWYTSASGQCW